MKLSQTSFAIYFNQTKLKPNIIYLWGYPLVRSESFFAPLDKLNCLLVAIPDAVMLSPAYARSYRFVSMDVCVSVCVCAGECV